MAALSAIGTRDHAEFNPHFQVGLDVAGRRCLVIGGGDEAGDKTGRLLEARAEVLVVAPQLKNLRLREWAAAGRIRHRPRRYRPTDLRHAHLVLNTVRSDAALCRRVFAQARRRRIPINTFDLPRYSTLAMAALVTCGHLRVSISTSNAAPALASRLRRDLEQILQVGAAAEPTTSGSGTLPETSAGRGRGHARPGLLARAGATGATSGELEQFLDGLGQVRELAKRRVASAAGRRTLLRGLVDGFRLTGTVHLPPAWRRRLAAARRELEGLPTTEPD